MSVFKEWCKKRRMRESFSDPADKFRFNAQDADFAEDQEKLQNELFKVVMSKYPEECLEFLRGISRRGDKEIGGLLAKLNRDGTPTQVPSHPRDVDEVIPHDSDSGFSGEIGD